MRRLLFILCLLLPTPIVADEDALVALGAQLEPLDSLSGEFAQVLYSVDQRELEKSSGRFQLLRPGYLAWHILEPDEQVLLAAGETLWHYDVELETATRRRIPEGNPTSPLTILGGDTRLLGEFYEVQRQSPVSWRLLPRFDDAEFTEVTLEFADGLPVSMAIRDRLGRSTRIDLASLDAGVALEPSDFEFRPPEGVDIYSNEP